jgi:hypothetical protein
MSTVNPSVRFHMAAIWCGVGFAVAFFAAIILMGLFPPPGPQVGAEELIAKAQDNLFLVKLGVPLGILAAGLSIPWNGLIAAHLWRIETSDGGMPIMALTSFCGGTGNTVLFLWPFLFWGGMYYRPDIAPEVFQTLHDITWLEIVMAFGPAVAQMLAIGIGGFLDKSQNPVFPRWCCFAMLWIGFLSLTGTIAIFVFSGPFAWNGAIGFWIPANAFGIWIGVLVYCMWKYVKNHR